MQKQQMVNENYEPNDREETVIDLFKEGHDSGDPWGRVNPLFLRQNSSLDKGQVEYALRNLKNAGWVKQVNQGGLYEFVDDPRKDGL
jgi:hypothetical protein